MRPENSNLADSTFRCERWRGFFSGITESAAGTFLVLIALSVYQSGPTEKALITGAGTMGFLIAPVSVWVGEKLQWKISRLASLMTAFASLCLLIPALFPFKSVFILGSIVGLALGSAITPLITQIYQDNFQPSIRGRLFSRTTMIRIFMIMVASQLLGMFLNGHLERFRWTLIVFSMAFAGISISLYLCPSKPLISSKAGHPFVSLKILKEDALFRLMAVCWMLLGIANLTMWAIRVEYLANPKYQVALEVSQVALLTGVIPNLARLFMSPIWGNLFDRMNFFVLRIILNIGFALGILAFFSGTSFSGLVIGALIFGISIAGGDVAWNLWVTKCAPPHRVAHYMSTHTFLTGIRGVLAPIFAFHLIESYSVTTLAWFCALLIVIASVLLIPQLKMENALSGVLPPDKDVSGG